MHRMRGYPQTIQLDLFRPPPQEPTWNQIPADARHKTVFLLVQMLHQHREHYSPAHRREAPRE